MCLMVKTQEIEKNYKEEKAIWTSYILMIKGTEKLPGSALRVVLEYSHIKSSSVMISRLFLDVCC